MTALVTSITTVAFFTKVPTVSLTVMVMLMCLKYYTWHTFPFVFSI